MAVKLTINISEDLRRRARLVALRRGETVADIVRAALEEYVQTHEAGGEGDANRDADPWAGDSILGIVGMVRGGPADMSSKVHGYLAEAYE